MNSSFFLSCFDSTMQNVTGIKVSVQFEIASETKEVTRNCVQTSLPIKVYAILLLLGLITACTVVQAVVQATGLVNGRGRFSTPTAPRPLDRFSWNLKYITTSRIRPRMKNFRNLCQRGWSGRIASLTHESFCPIFRFFARATGRISKHTPTRNTSLYVVLAKVVPFGG